MLYWCVLVTQSCGIFCEFMCCSPSRLLCPWNSTGKNTGVGSHSLLQGIFPTQWLNPGLLHCRQVFYCLSHQGSLIILMYHYLLIILLLVAIWVSFFFTPINYYNAHIMAIFFFFPPSLWSNKCVFLSFISFGWSSRSRNAELKDTIDGSKFPSKSDI